jgi:succinyl-CoA synthetase beta subunit
LKLPVVIRMEGTNVEAARRILDECGLNFTIAASMLEAARLIAERTKESRS